MSTILGDRIIVLIDMDCFFCQVEAKLQPEWKGKPMAVVQYNLWRSGGIIAVNYEARDFGVTRHMRGDEAKEKCPEIVLAVVPSLRGKADTSRYRTAGRSVIDVMKNHCNKIERASVDEAYLDITQVVDERMSQYSEELSAKLNTTYVVGHSEVGTNDEEQRVNGLKEWLRNTEDTDDIQARRLAVAGLIVEEIRADIYEKTEYRCSAGISYNKILAKLACGLHKPNRQTILPSAAVPALFSTLPVKKVRNLGGKFGDIVIESLKCNVMADLLQYPLQYLQNRFDEKTGSWLYNIARGIDNEPVTNRLLAKSIGACKRFPGKQALKTPENLKHWLGELAAEVCERLEQDNEENERRATHLTFSYQFNQDGNMVSQSKSLPLNSYKQEKVQLQCYEVVTKIQHPIAFLGLSAAKFVKAKGSQNFRNFFTAEKTQPTIGANISTVKQEKHQESMHLSNNDDQKSLRTDEKCEKKLDEKNEQSPNQAKSKKINSFFKLINNIPSPKCETIKEKEKEKIVTKENREKGKQFFAKLIVENTNDADHDDRASVSTENTTSTVRLQDIFPDLNNIDRDILACLPADLQKEAASLMKNKTTDKASPKTNKQINGKVKLENPRKNKGKPIESFFIKTGGAELDVNFVNCEQCGQMISAKKVDEHRDYHVAQRLQKDINRLSGDENTNKRKNSTDDNTFPNKRLAENRG